MAQFYHHYRDLPHRFLPLYAPGASDFKPCQVRRQKFGHPYLSFDNRLEYFRAKDAEIIKNTNKSKTKTKTQDIELWLDHSTLNILNSWVYHPTHIGIKCQADGECAHSPLKSKLVEEKKGYTYTVGLQYQYNHPDLIVLGKPGHKLIQKIFNNLAQYIAQTRQLLPVGRKLQILKDIDLTFRWATPDEICQYHPLQAELLNYLFLDVIAQTYLIAEFSASKSTKSTKNITIQNKINDVELPLLVMWYHSKERKKKRVKRRIQTL
jgi:hypothetical protein